uniref:NOP protein chaperone 1 n=1 Tax=Nothobranchius furzeri TaxID=105023 RepID=A0A8C6P2M3_NOTFU
MRGLPKMDQNAKKTTSRSLLSCGNEGALSEKLLLKRKAGKSLKTERVPRSSMLERLQNFLPQMAEANMKLTQQMEKAPPGHFDIENVDKAEKVIEMLTNKHLDEVLEGGGHVHVLVLQLDPSTPLLDLLH